MQVRPVPRSSANEHTAITIALRVPTFANCCGPAARGIQTAAISSSAPSTLRFGPVDEVVDGHPPRAPRRGQLDLRATREQRRQRVTGG